jgi:uncharacterized protein (TIGR03066 family)
MLQIRIAAAVVLALGLMAGNLGLARDDKKADTTKDKLTAVWQVTKSADLPPGASIEFAKDSKLKITIPTDDKPIMFEGTWSVDGKDLKVAVTVDGKEEKQTLKIVELTDTKLVTKDEKDKQDEFKKVVAKDAK